MKWQDLFSKFKMLSAAVVIGALGVYNVSARKTVIKALVS